MPTLRRRNSDPSDRGRAPLRSSLADAAWAVEDRVVWGAADLVRAVVDAVKWPFERIAWAVEHWLIWPIQEETALWSRPVRADRARRRDPARRLPALRRGSSSRTPPPAARPRPPTPSGCRPREDAVAPRPDHPLRGAEAATGGQVLQGSSPELATEQGGGDHESRGRDRTARLRTSPPTRPAPPAPPTRPPPPSPPAPRQRPAGPASDVAPPAAIEVAREVLRRLRPL